VPAIVEPELFAAVQAILAEHRRHPGQAAQRPRYLLAGLVVCRRCGYAYRGRPLSKGGKRYHYYRCAGAEPARCPGGQRVCGKPAIALRMEQLDEAVWSDVQALLLEPEHLAAEFQRRLKGDSGAGAERRTSQGLDKLIAQAKRRIARLVEMYAQGYMEKDQFQRDMDVSRSRLSDWETERQSLCDAEQQREELRLVIGRIEEFAAQVRAGLDTSGQEVRRRIICALVKQVEIDAEGVHIVYRVSPRPFARTAPTGGSMPLCWGRPCDPSGRQGTSPRAEGRESIAGSWRVRNASVARSRSNDAKESRPLALHPRSG